MSVIAWRLHWLTYLNRCQPDLPCTAALTTVEWEALYMRIHKTKRLPDEVLDRPRSGPLGRAARRLSRPQV